MKKNLYLIIALLCTMVQGAWAEELTKKQALELAKQFVASHINVSDSAGNAARGNIRQTAPTINEAGQVSGLYLFNVSNDGGFVIVSNDDRTVPILGFGQQGNIDPDNMPDNMRAWLQGYADQIEWLKQHEGFQDSSFKIQVSSSNAKVDIEPLITTKWDQDKPYNNLCPEIDGTRTITGCAATTIAQIMNYYKWPKDACKPIPSYDYRTVNKDKDSISVTVDGIPATTFDWENIIDIYVIKDPKGKEQPEYFGNETQQHAVAELMQYSGAAMHMQYGLPNVGSGVTGYEIAYAMKTYFGYDGGMEYSLRTYYTYQDWVDLIYNELAENRPVFLGGQSSNGGHAFVCDGYKFKDGADYFNINWGWSGIYDNYFLLSLLNPIEKGMGGRSSLDGFGFGQFAIIGVQPSVEGNKDYGLFLNSLCLSKEDSCLTSKTFSRKKAADDFKDINIYFQTTCFDLVPMDYDIALQFVDGSGNVVNTLETFKEELDWNKDTKKDVNLTIPSTVGDGTYYIKVACRPTGSDEWMECHLGNRQQLTAEISGNTLTIEVPLPKNTYPAATLSVTGDLKRGHEQTVTATFSDGIYNGDVLLFVNDKFIMGQELNLKAGETVELQFAFIPNEAGENTLTLYNSYNDNKIQIGSPTTVEIIEDATDVASVSGERSAFSEAGAWFDLFGRKLKGKPTQKGMYIHNSKAVAVD